jgi:putative ABC transport system permease protein
MTVLVLAMLWARRAQAATVLLLAAFATAVAVAAPVYGRAAERSVTVTELAAATPIERTITVQRTRTVAGADRDFEQSTPKSFTFAGFTTVLAIEFDAYALGPAGGSLPRLVYRDGACEHVVLRAGRCVAGVGEAIVGPETAKRLGAGVGGTFTVQWADFTADGWAAKGPPAVLSVVGVYEPRDPTEPYWAGRLYFDRRDYERGPPEPVLVGRLAMEAVEHPTERQSVDAVAETEALVDRPLAAVRDDVRVASRGSLRGGVIVSSRLPDLLDRIEHNRSLIRRVVPIAAVPLVLLSWLVIFLAVAYGVQERRYEAGLIALRGVSRPYRWWLGVGESLVPIVVGAPLGYLLGHLVVARVARVALPSPGPVSVSAAPLGYAALALAGALLAGLLAARRDLGARVVDLLRKVPLRAARWRGAVAETVVIALAAAAAVQLRLGGGELAGVGMLVPGLVIIGFGLVAARAVVPVAERLGGRALRRGRLAPALAALHLSRRPGGARLLSLLVVAVALLGFAATSASVAARARTDRATVELGAHRVLTVDALSRRQLLTGVQAVDPAGRFAMAVVTIPPTLPGETPTIAVDAPRLPAVVLWPGTFGPLTPAKAAELLHPPSPAPYLLHGRELVVDATADGMDPQLLPHLVADLAPQDGAVAAGLDLGALVPGRHTYRVPVSGCLPAAGCRLAGFTIVNRYRSSFSMRLTLHAVPDVVPAGELSRPGAWRPPGDIGSALSVPTLTTGPDGLVANIERGSFGTDARILAADSPYPLRVIEAGEPAQFHSGFDGRRHPTARVARTAAIPRLGTAGALVDFEYAERATGNDAHITPALEVWLGPAAPPDVVERLAGHGVAVIGERSLADVRQRLDSQGPAVALRFHLVAAVAAVVLAVGSLVLVAAVDRRRRAEEVRALRRQGVSRRAVARSGYVSIVATAVLLGLSAAAVAWLVAGETVPLFADQVRLLPPPRWPAPAELAVPLVTAALVLLATAVIATWASRGEVR